MSAASVVDFQSYKKQILTFTTKHVNPPDFVFKGRRYRVSAALKFSSSVLGTDCDKHCYKVSWLLL